MDLRFPARLALIAAFALCAATPAFARGRWFAPPAARRLRSQRQAQRRQPYGQQPYGPNQAPGPYANRPYAQRQQPYRPNPNQPYAQQPPVPIGHPNAAAPGQQPYAANRTARTGIGTWMQQHQNLPVQDQLRALDNEPGFRQSAPAEQQRLRNQLIRLSQLPPAQRAERLARLSTLERLTPGEIQLWRDGLQRMTSGPPLRQQVMGNAFRTLRQLPPAQRQAILASPAFAAQFSPEERTAISGALLGEPYPPIRVAPAR